MNRVHKIAMVKVTPNPNPMAAGDKLLLENDTICVIKLCISDIAIISITKIIERGAPNALATASAYLTLADINSSLPLKMDINMYADHRIERAVNTVCAINGVSKN